MEATLAALGLILDDIEAAAPLIIPVLYTLLVAAALDLLSGVWAAQKSGTFELAYISEFVKSHIALKVGPIILALVAGAAMGGIDSAAGLALIATAATTGAAYLASVVASIRENLTAGNAGLKGLPSGIVPPQTELVEPVEVGTTTLSGA